MLLFFSCKKEGAQKAPPSPSGEKYIIQFNAGGFSQQITDINNPSGRGATRQGDSLKAHVKYLYYFLFGENSTMELKRIVQDSSDPNFGIISDTVAAGKYRIALAGTNQVSRWTSSITSECRIYYAGRGRLRQNL